MGQVLESQQPEPFLDRTLELALCVCDQGIAVCREGRVVWANESLAKLVGCASPEKVIGTPIEDLLGGAVQGLPGLTGDQCVECRVNSGEVGEFHVRVRRFRAQGDLHEVWLVRDETRVRALEAEVLRVGRGLQEANRDLAALRESARQRSREREELFTVLSHELRTPVTVISGYTRLLLSGDVGSLNEEQLRFLRESSRSCKRLDAFIGKLISASRDDDGGGALELHDASLASAIEGVVRFLRPLLDERELQVDLQLDEHASRARFDLMRVEQVLTNLLGNALRYAQRGGTIEIATRHIEAAGHRFVEVSVSDDGPGVAEPDRERVFEPYVRAGSEGRAGGLGLGLAICKRIVASHGGAIRVTEREGGGSRFAFTLPAVK